MSCLSKEQLIDYLFAAESPSPASVGEHLAACAGCRAELEFLKRLKTAAGSAPLPPVSVNFTDRLMRALPTEAPRKGFLRGFYGRGFRPAWAFALAGCAVLFYLGLATWRGPGAPQPGAPEALCFSDGPATVKKVLAAPQKNTSAKTAVYSYTDGCAAARCGLL